MSISYDTYFFPAPLPSVVISDEPIYIAGKLDHTKQKIQLIGTITGSNLNSLSEAKKEMEIGLLNPFESLDLNGESFDICRPLSINFSDSDLTTLLPYSVEFEAFDEKGFTEFYGISDPTDSWSYSEQDGRIISATHTVSARGVKVDGNDSLQNARTFVNSRLNGFENYSIINPDISESYIREKTEEINRFQNIYSVTEVYTLSSSRSSQPENSLVTVTTQINYSKNSESSVTVSGNIIGSVGGTLVNKSMFTASQAKNQAIKSIEESRSLREADLYEILQKGPSSSSFEINEVDNSLTFSYTFSDAFFNEDDEAEHIYTVNISASKDSALINVSINGEIRYKGIENIYSGEDIEDSPRYLAILAKFESINPYDFAVQEYVNFYSVVQDFDGNSYLDPEPLSESITKNPFEPSISYSYSYSNKANFNLKNLTLEYTDEKPIIRIDLVETLGGFQENRTSILGKKTVTASANEPDSSLNGLKSRIESYLPPYCFIFEESSSESPTSISAAKSVYYV
jgi:hypothetical protein